jgi:hypothetical protein
MEFSVENVSFQTTLRWKRSNVARNSARRIWFRHSCDQNWTVPSRGSSFIENTGLKRRGLAFEGSITGKYTPPHN